mmetsp:Transcript_25580/g.45521  ORF Transcript_25580/g.45521 Transcript_25580/m.45521 type:complete len:145 (-) Transcript_25580:64-498(-)
MISFLVQEALGLLKSTEVSCGEFGFWPVINNIVLLYCAMKTFQAMQTVQKDDDEQWLTFWLVFIIFDLICSVVNWFAKSFIPFYEVLKLVFILFLGFAGGAQMIYPHLESRLLQVDKVNAKFRSLDGLDPEKQPLNSSKKCITQ